MPDDNDPNNFKILIATDNHLGYGESDPKLAQDSFNTFDEILEFARQSEVDFVLLGGDLFHENKPSKRSMMQCMNSLARYCRGDVPIRMKIISDASENFKGALNPIPNWEDPNINICLPIFTIHGNHDDPSGVGNFCPLDLLSTAGLVNYIGRMFDYNKSLRISPVLLQKGNTLVAIYAISSIRDDRLYKLFSEKKVIFPRVKADVKTFNILVIHQNRQKHSDGRYIPEHFLKFHEDGKPFFHLVIWGHEHECKLEVERAVGDSYFLLQPGSSVATSLCPGEAVEKRMFLMTVSGTKFRMTPHTLKTVRPMVHKTVNLPEVEDEWELHREDCTERIERNLTRIIMNAVEEGKQKLNGHPNQPLLPLIRINVEYKDESHIINPLRFGQRFDKIIANPDNVVLLKRILKTRTRATDEEVDGHTADLARDAFSTLGPATIGEVTAEYYKAAPPENQPVYFSAPLLVRTLEQYVSKYDEEAWTILMNEDKDKMDKYLAGLAIMNEELDDDAIAEEFDKYLALKRAREDEDLKNDPMMDPRTPRAPRRSDSSAASNGTPADDGAMDVDSDDEFRAPRASGRGRSSSRPTRARGRGRGRARVSDDDDDEDGLVSPPVSGRGRGRGRGRGARGGSRQTSMDSFIRGRNRI